MMIRVGNYKFVRLLLNSKFQKLNYLLKLLKIISNPIFYYGRGSRLPPPLYTPATRGLVL